MTEYIKMCDCEEIQTKYPANELVGSDMLPDGRILDDNGDVFMFSPTTYGNLIWLPGPGDLQEMVNENGILNMFHSFMEWFNSDEEYEQLPMDSMEQLWLAFVMQEKHSKTWNGKEWT